MSWPGLQEELVDLAEDSFLLQNKFSWAAVIPSTGNSWLHKAFKPAIKTNVKTFLDAPALVISDNVN